MRDSLREYICEHVRQFDLHEPPDLWQGVAAGILAPKTVVKPVKTISMIKYGLGLSVLAASTIVVLRQNMNSEKQKQVLNVPVEKGHVTSAKLIAEPVITSSKTTSEKAPPKSCIPAVADSSQKSFFVAAPVTPVVAVPLPLSPPDSVVSAKPASSSDTVFSGIKELDVNVKFCKVRLYGVNGNDLLFSSHMGNGGTSGIQVGKRMVLTTHAVIKWKVNGSQLKVWMESERGNSKICTDDEPSVISFGVPAGMKLNIRNSSGGIVADSIASPSAHLSSDFGSIVVDRMRGMLNLAAESGRMKILHVNGDVNCRGDFGSMQLVDIEGNVDAVCSSGNITVDGLKGDAKVKSSFGGQKYNNVVGRISAEASSGSLKFSNCKGNIDAHSDFGSQSYEKVRGNIHAEASSGTVKLDDTKGKLEAVTSFGSIKGENVELSGSANLKASSGVINIDLINPMSELTFHLSSSSGKSSIIDGDKIIKSENALQSGSGPIIVSGSTSFGNQTYR